MGLVNKWTLRLLTAGSLLLMLQVLHHFHGTVTTHLASRRRDADMYIMNRAVFNVYTGERRVQSGLRDRLGLKDIIKGDNERNTLISLTGHDDVNRNDTGDHAVGHSSPAPASRAPLVPGYEPGVNGHISISALDGSNSDSSEDGEVHEDDPTETLSEMSYQDVRLAQDNNALAPPPLQITIPEEDKYIPDSRTDLGPNLRYLLNVMYDDAGFQTAPSQVPVGIWNTTGPRVNVTEHTAWEILGRREVPGVDCPALMRDEEDALNFRERSRMHLMQPTDGDYESLAGNCPTFIKSRGYVMSDTPEAEQFPIAYSVLTFADLSQTERLLRAIYRPQNFYCIHIERYSPESMHRAVRAIANCLPNVFVLPVRYHVTRFLMSVLQPELACMEALHRYSAAWKYFINLTGQEFPILTNPELVHMLKGQNGQNIIGGLPIARTRSVSRIYHQYNGFLKTSLPLGPAPHNITIYKGPVHIAVTRGFVDQLLHDSKVDDLLEWLRKMRTPDESLFATLHFNPSLNMPGSPRIRPRAYQSLQRLLRNDVSFQHKRDSSMIRFKRFVNLKCCPGTKVTHEVCIVGTKLLPVATHSGALFANKFHVSYQPVAYDCLENWHFNRTLGTRS